MCKREEKQVSQISTIVEGNISADDDVSKKEKSEDKGLTEELSKARIGIISSDGLVYSQSASDLHSRRFREYPTR